MKDLIIKEVDFQSNKIIAISENGKIYVSVSSVCTNLGMNKNLKDTQVKKVQEDELLKGASKLTHLKTNGGIQETLVIELDYLPAWLFKINPSKFNKELKENLMIYQLKAKDVLSDAFFGKRTTSLNPVEVDKKFDWLIKRVRDRTDRTEHIENMISYLFEVLEKEYKKISEDINFKIDFVSKHFLDFKTDEKYNVSKEKLPVLVEVEEALTEKIKKSEATRKPLEQKKLTTKE